MSVNSNDEGPLIAVPLALATMTSGSAIPSAKLAQLTVDRLIQSGLLSAEKRDALIAKIACGSMNEQDWKLAITLATAKPAN